VTARFLADKSAITRLRQPAVTAALEPLLLAGEVATCGIIELGILFSARNYADFVQARLERELGYPLVPTIQEDFVRALDIMGELARRGLHRAIGISDLLIAAIAERELLTILHYDADFDIVAGVTVQPTRWVVPRGSVP
jgi:predicted nucleic acid-binding protein